MMNNFFAAESRSFVLNKLFLFQDTAYGDFQSRLTPGISREKFIGVRMPVCRKIAKEFISESMKDAAVEKELRSFLETLPHNYYEENVLHGILISQLKDFNEAIAAMEKFLPFIDNWAVCDSTWPKVFSTQKKILLAKIKEWTESESTYTIRFGIESLMRCFLDEDFDSVYLEIPASVVSKEYYVNMMIAWFFATALSKQWKSTIPYIEQNHLPLWVHNKTIQKARESFRITDEQKKYLSTLKR